MVDKILPKEAYRILELLSRNLFRRYSIREIMIALKKKSYSGVFNIIARLHEAGIIKIEKIGHSSICSLDIRSPVAVAHLALLENIRFNSAKHMPHKNVQSIASKMKSPFFILMVTGSYASGKQTRKSDLDAVLIVDERSEKKEILSDLADIELMVPAVHMHIFRRPEFLGMILAKGLNFGKEAAKNRLIAYGAEAYYRLIAEAIDNGYKGEALS